MFYEPWMTSAGATCFDLNVQKSASEIWGRFPANNKFNFDPISNGFWRFYI